MEGAWTTEKGAPLILFAIPNEELKKNEYAIEIPYLGSLIATNSLDGTIRGLEEFEYYPPVAPVFFGFRTMIGIGMLMLSVAWLTAFMLYKKRPLSKLMHKLLVAMSWSGFIATTAGWYVTEIGRQPWLVQDVLMAKDALGPVSGKNVLFTLIVYSFIYAFVSFSYIYTLIYMAKHAGDHTPSDPERQGVGMGQRHTSAFKKKDYDS